MLHDFEMDNHSPYHIRVNGVLTQMPQFALSFNCFEGEGMTADEVKFFLSLFSEIIFSVSSKKKVI